MTEQGRQYSLQGLSDAVLAMVMLLRRIRDDENVPQQHRTEAERLLGEGWGVHE